MEIESIYRSYRDWLWSSRITASAHIQKERDVKNSDG